MALKHVVEISAEMGVEGVTTAFPAGDMISGDPETTMWTAFSGGATSVIAGFWESEAFKKGLKRPAMAEYFYILEGTVRLTDAEGNSETFGPGQGVLIKPGFDGFWESLTKVRKHFFIAVC